MDTKVHSIDPDRIKRSHQKMYLDYIIPGCFFVSGASKRATHFFDCDNNDIESMLKDHVVISPAIKKETIQAFLCVLGYKDSDFD